MSGDTASRAAELAGTAAVALAFVGIGVLFESSTGLRHGNRLAAAAYALLHGWSVALIVALGLAVLDARLALAMAIVAATGFLAYGLAAARAAVAPLLLAWLLLAPLLVIAAGSPAAMYDEFAHWLPNARFLIENGVFPTSSLPNIWTGKPEYPPGSAVVSYLAHLLSGAGVEASPKIFVIVLTAGFGLVVADAIQDRIGRFAAIGLGTALASVANPFFDPRIVLTSYADAPTGFVLALCLAACWQGLQSGQSIWTWRAAAASLVLVFLRETNVVLVFALGAGLAVCGGRGRRLAAAVLVSAGLAFTAWRLHLWGIGLRSTITSRPLEAWDWTAPGTVLRVLLIDRLGNNPVLGLAALVFVMAALGAAAWVVRHAKPGLRPLLWLLVIVSLGWTGFLAWSYTAVFTPQEVANAGSAWRYFSQLGPSLIFVIVTVGAGLWADRPRMEAAGRSGIAVSACALPVAAVLLTPSHWRAECRFPDVDAARAVAQQFRDKKLGDSELTVVHPVDAAWYAVAIDYDLHRPHGRSRAISARENADGSDDVLDLSALDRSSLAKGGEIPTITFEHQAEGQPRRAVEMRVTALHSCAER